MTTAQQARCGEWIGRYVQMGLSTEPADFQRATTTALRVYKLLDLREPAAILHLGSPYACAAGGEIIAGTSRPSHCGVTSFRSRVLERVRARIGAQISAQVRGEARALAWECVGEVVNAATWNSLGSQIRSQLRNMDHGRLASDVLARLNIQLGERSGDYDTPTVRLRVPEALDRCVGDGWANNYGGSLGNIGWVAFVAFMRDVIGIEVDPMFSVEEELAESCGWVNWHENALVVSDRPVTIRRDALGRLHNGNGPSVAYRDGCELYHLHGMEPPPEFRRLLSLAGSHHASASAQIQTESFRNSHSSDF